MTQQTLARRASFGPKGCAVGGWTFEDGLEELQGEAERELALGLGTASAQCAHPRAVCQRRRLAQQARLAEPGHALDEDDPAGTGPRAVERCFDDRQLPITLDQRVGGRLSHAPTLACEAPAQSRHDATLMHGAASADTGVTATSAARLG
jgi:hypothetical protein